MIAISHSLSSASRTRNSNDDTIPSDESLGYFRSSAARTGRKYGSSSADDFRRLISCLGMLTLFKAAANFFGSAQCFRHLIVPEFTRDDVAGRASFDFETLSHVSSLILRPPKDQFHTSFRGRAQNL